MFTVNALLKYQRSVHKSKIDSPKPIIRQASDVKNSKWLPLVLYPTSAQYHSHRQNILSPLKFPCKPQSRCCTWCRGSIGNCTRCFWHNLAHSGIGRSSITIARCSIQRRRIQEGWVCIANAGNNVVRIRSGSTLSSGIARWKDSTLRDLIVTCTALE